MMGNSLESQTGILTAN
jgi:hypothetical protein